MTTTTHNLSRGKPCKELPAETRSTTRSTTPMSLLAVSGTDVPRVPDYLFPQFICLRTFWKSIHGTSVIRLPYETISHPPRGSGRTIRPPPLFPTKDLLHSDSTQTFPSSSSFRSISSTPSTRYFYLTEPFSEPSSAFTRHKFFGVYQVIPTSCSQPPPPSPYSPPVSS